MDIDELVVRALSAEVDPEDSPALADLFALLLAEEHAARHQSRPRLVRKFTEMIDRERGAS